MGRRILCLFLNAKAVTHRCTLLLPLLFPVGEVLCKKERRKKKKGSSVWLGDYEAEEGGTSFDGIQDGFHVCHRQQAWSDVTRVPV